MTGDVGEFRIDEFADLMRFDVWCAGNVDDGAAERADSLFPRHSGGRVHFARAMIAAKQNIHCLALLKFAALPIAGVCRPL